MSKEPVIRTYTLTDSLEDGTDLFKTAYGSLLTGQMVKERACMLLDRAMSQLIRRGDTLTISIAVAHAASSKEPS